MARSYIWFSSLTPPELARKRLQGSINDLMSRVPKLLQKRVTTHVRLWYGGGFTRPLDGGKEKWAGHIIGGPIGLEIEVRLQAVKMKAAASGETFKQ